MPSPRRSAPFQTESTLSEGAEEHVARLEAALARARVINEGLRRVGMAIGGAADLDELLVLILETTTDIAGAERGTLYLLKGDRLVSRVKQGRELHTIEVGLGQGIAGHVAASGQSLLVPDAYRDERFDSSFDEQSGFHTRSILAVPLKDHRQRTIGVLQVLNKRGGVFDRHDAELLSTLATLAAVAIDKARLIGRLVKRHDELAATKERLERTLRDIELLYELETALLGADRPIELAREVITRTARACSAEAGAMLLDDRSGELAGVESMLYLVSLERPGEVRTVPVRHDEGIAERRIRALLGAPLRSTMLAALHAPSTDPAEADRSFGALALYNHSGRPSRFSEEDGALLRLVAANVSTALRLYEARRERERSERLTTIGQLMSGVMHDLRTPLTVISGYVQLMQLSDDGVRRAEYARIVSEQFELVAAMQRDLLAYARGETTVLMRKVHLARFCEDLVQQFKPELEAAAIELALEIERGGIAFFDEVMIARALQNLVRNALEAMQQKPRSDEPSRLTLQAYLDGDELALSVGDNGPGLPRVVRERLFEPFVTAGKKSGTGLGLASVKKAADEHGGRVEVSTGKRGTTFTLFLPQGTRPHSRRMSAPPELER